MKRSNLLVAICALFLVCSVVKAADKTFKPDGDGYIHNWLLLDPIALDDKASNHDEDNQKDFFNKEFFPGQKTVTPKEGDKIKVGADELTWKAFSGDDAVLKFEPKDNSLYLAVVYVTSENEVADATISIGSDDSSAWKVNGTEVVRVFAGRAVDKDQDKSKAFVLKKGVNVIMASVINGGGETGLSCRVLDKGDKPVPGLVISFTPPAK